jgi:hypothetical protein
LIKTNYDAGSTPMTAFIEADSSGGGGGETPGPRLNITV